MIMQNLLKSFKGTKIFEGIPIFKAIVVITDAIIKYIINIGNDFFRLKPDFLLFDLSEFIIASTIVIGMMARVLVSFTVTALSRVWVPRFHILSHVDAAAVTEEVSFIAVPEKIPKASPLKVSKPIIFPNIGKSSAANTLKKNITDIACATSPSSALITGAVAAMAEPPHIEDPTPIRVDILPGIFMIL